ncbi:MAG: response regulator [Leptospiraceae bacterium]|nr:response regulator [Leptospiraceae bacterium]MCK6381486.1 response regulator [Leptospiraceae bacterium]
MKKILIVDDQPQISRILTDILVSEGFQVEVARNGAIGVAKTIEIKPDLIFMDIMMPVKDGFEATREIRNIKEFESTPIVFLTAKGQSSDREKAIEVGGNEFITKPFSPKKILEVVKSILST